MRRETVLIIEDDPAILFGLRDNFERAGYGVRTAVEGHLGLDLARSLRPDLLLLDLMLPGRSGYEICQTLRAEDHDMPIIMITALGQEDQVIRGLNLGADDYVTKPFSTRVLLARVGALLRREQMRKAPEPADTTIRAGGLELSTERMEATFGGRAFVTTVTEFRLLCVLAARPGVVFTREQLLERIRGDDSVVVDRLVDTYVRRLRRKIEELDASFDGIETLVGAGYRWRDR